MKICGIGESMGDIYIKEEVIINDAACSEFEDEASSIENEQFTLCFINGHGNVLVEECDIVGSPSPNEIVESSSLLGRKLSKTKNYQRLASKQKIQNKHDTKKKYTKEKKPIGEKQNLSEHLDRSYLCELCHSEFKGKKIFNHHLNKHFTVNNKSYYCNLCLYMTPLRGHISRHVIRSHCVNSNISSDQRIFACSLCDKRFFERKDLVRHEFVHTRCGPFKCNVCTYSHVKKCDLERHMLCHHPDKIPAQPRQNNNNKYECNECGHTCYSKSKITRHIEQHLGIYRYVCDVCGYKCQVRGDFQKHTTIHSEDRPFVCDQCLKTFKRKSHLTSHIQGVHIINRTNHSCRNRKRAKKY